MRLIIFFPKVFFKYFIINKKKYQRLFVDIMWKISGARLAPISYFSDLIHYVVERIQTTQNKNVAFFIANYVAFGIGISRKRKEWELSTPLLEHAYE